MPVILSRGESSNALTAAPDTESAFATEPASEPAIFGRHVVESSAVARGEFGGTQCPRGISGAARPSAEPVTDREPVAGSGVAGQRGGGSAVVSMVYMAMVPDTVK